MSKIKQDSRTQKRNCPKCKYSELERIRRNPIIKLFLDWTGLRKYRCDRCNKEFYALN